MRALLALTTSIALLGGGAAPGPTAAAAAAEEPIDRVETSLPPITRDGETVALSLPEWMEALAVPGLSVAVVDDYRIAWAKGYGVLEAGAAPPVTARTLFQAASISKPVAALALLHFAERGVFDLDADVGAYLRRWKLPPSELAAPGTVTLRRLLAHTAGITPGGFTGYPRNAPMPTLTQILEGEPPANHDAARVVSVPGEAVRYSGLGYMMIELALEDSLGKPFEEIVAATVLDPAGLRDSTFGRPLPKALAARAARGHHATGAVVEGGWYVYPESAAAGMWSTPSDLARLAIEVARSESGASNRILSSETTRRMLTRYQEEMGLGFVVRSENEHGYFAHSGGNQGYRCHVEMLAESGDGVAVMTSSDAGGALIALLLRSVAEVYEWPWRRPLPVPAGVTDALFAQLELAKTRRVEVDVGEEILARYVGRYELAPGLVFDVRLVAGRLEVQLGDQPRFPVYPESESKFFYEVVDAQLTFVQNAAGETVALLLHQGGRDQEARRIED